MISDKNQKDERNRSGKTKEKQNVRKIKHEELEKKKIRSRRKSPEIVDDNDVPQNGTREKRNPDTKRRSDKQKQNKVAKIVCANVVIDPRTVMVKANHTSVAYITMLCAHWPYNLANVTHFALLVK